MSITRSRQAASLGGFLHNSALAGNVNWKPPSSMHSCAAAISLSSMSSPGSITEA
ncbi:hypothetical protein [Achromobacter ruhlandii]|uniref:hypothetical protein n=1 Tax=Achromobacter ruhlandii TaxID=72557 RepID=UPI0012E97F49|nr:hypothetical protein [Achromobacter ruhlandii]